MISEKESIVEETASSPTGSENADPSILAAIFNEIVYSPMNMALVVIIVFLIYKIIKDRFEVPSIGTQKPAEPELPKMRRRDFTIQELRQFDGNQPDGRVLLAVNGKVYDVTKGKRFYGPGGPYAPFAGRDASRNLATFSMTPNESDEYDDLSDLSAMEMESVREWEMQFNEKYDLIGKLLRKGEQPTNYDDEDEEEANDDKAAAGVAAAAGDAAATENGEKDIGSGLKKRNVGGGSDADSVKKTTSSTEEVKGEE